MLFFRKRLVRPLLLLFVPSNITDVIFSEVTTSLQTWLSSGRIRRTFVGKSNFMVNIGCGNNPVKGWINLDLRKGPDLTYWDCRRGLPFDNGSVTGIFTEHFFEHLDYRVEAPFFLRECWRSLKPGGVLRVIVPDGGLYLSLYQKDWSCLARVRPLIEEGDRYRDYWLNDIYETKMELINSVFRQNGEHKYTYDADTLVKLMQRCGFTQVVQQKYGTSLLKELMLDRRDRANESLYVEGIK